MKVIIAGSRDFNNYELLKDKCDYYLQNYDDIEIVSGLARVLEIYNKYIK